MFTFHQCSGWGDSSGLVKPVVCFTEVREQSGADLYMIVSVLTAPPSSVSLTAPTQPHKYTHTHLTDGEGGVEWSGDVTWMSEWSGVEM